MATSGASLGAVRRTTRGTQQQHPPTGAGQSARCSTTARTRSAGSGSHPPRRRRSKYSINGIYVAIDTLPPEEQERLARQLWEESGARSLPLTRIAGRFVEGYDAEALRTAIREVKLEDE